MQFPSFHNVGRQSLGWPPDILLDYEVIAYRRPTKEEAQSLLQRIEVASSIWLREMALIPEGGRPRHYYSQGTLKRRWGVIWGADLRGLGIHWSGNASLHGTCAALLSPSRQASSHFVIHWDGSIIQLYPTHVATWHGCENQHRLGVDFVHPGWLTERSPGYFVDWAGRAMPDHVRPLFFDRATVPMGYRQHTDWAGYTLQQIRSLVVLGRLINNGALMPPWTNDNIPFLLGHHQVGPTKSDVWHFPLQLIERDIQSNANTLAPDWWAIEAVQHLEQFIGSSRADGTL